MNRPIALRNLVLACLTIALATVAAAQNPPTARIRGQIEKIDGQTVTIKSRDSAIVTVKLADNVGVNGVTKASLSDVTPGKYVGIASLPTNDGGLRALEVLILPDAMRGTNEGHFAWDLQPQSMMTNAMVAEVATAPAGRTLSLRYKDGEQKIVVPEGVPIVTMSQVDRSALVAGAHVFIFAAQRQPDGTFNAARINVGLNGLVPPM